MRMPIAGRDDTLTYFSLKPGSFIRPTVPLAGPSWGFRWPFLGKRLPLSEPYKRGVDPKSSKPTASYQFFNFIKEFTGISLS